MSKALKDLTDDELADYCAEIADSAKKARIVGGPLPVVIVNASVSAAAEASTRWGLR
jgi:hypothetical protein